jgi:hypothetical protein
VCGLTNCLKNGGAAEVAFALRNVSEIYSKTGRRYERFPYLEFLLRMVGSFEAILSCYELTACTNIIKLTLTLVWLWSVVVC